MTQMFVSDELEQEVGEVASKTKDEDCVIVHGQQADLRIKDFCSLTQEQFNELKGNVNIRPTRQRQSDRTRSSKKVRIPKKYNNNWLNAWTWTSGGGLRRVSENTEPPSYDIELNVNDEILKVCESVTLKDCYVSVCRYDTPCQRCITNLTKQASRNTLQKFEKELYGRDLSVKTEECTSGASNKQPSFSKPEQSGCNKKSTTVTNCTSKADGVADRKRNALASNSACVSSVIDVENEDKNSNSCICVSECVDMSGSLEQGPSVAKKARLSVSEKQASVDITEETLGAVSGKGNGERESVETDVCQETVSADHNCVDAIQGESDISEKCMTDVYKLGVDRSSCIQRSIDNWKKRENAPKYLISNYTKHSGNNVVEWRLVKQNADCHITGTTIKTEKNTSSESPVSHTTVVQNKTGTGRRTRTPGGRINSAKKTFEWRVVRPNTREKDDKTPVSLSSITDHTGLKWKFTKK